MKKIIPSFLLQLDKYLLLNHPIIWISRIHYVLSLGIIMTLFSALIGFIIPLNLSQTQDLALWYFLFTILAIVALCFWIYHNIIFNIEKKYGKRVWFDEYKIFTLNFLCVLIFSCFPFSFTYVYNQRVANSITTNEFINDINTLNLGEVYSVNNINNYQSTYDTTKQITYNDVRKCIIFDTYTPWKIKYDTIRFRNLLSTDKLNSVYKKTHSETEIKTLINDYLVVYRKYRPNYNESGDTIYNRYIRLQKASPINSATYASNSNYYNESYEMERIFTSISDAKFMPLFIWQKEFQLFIFYTCLFISLLVMLFKMVYWRQYLITFISFIVIPIILFIISQLFPYSGYSSRDNLFLILLVIVLLVALVFTILGIARTKQFNAFRNICAQIIYLVLPVLPLMLVVLFKDIFYTYNYNYTANMYDGADAVGIAQNTNSYYNTPQYIYTQLEQAYWDRMYDLSVQIAMYGGVILFILVLMPLMKNLFVKQLALPRKS